MRETYRVGGTPVCGLIVEPGQEVWVIVPSADCVRADGTEVLEFIATKELDNHCIVYAVGGRTCYSWGEEQVC